MYIQVFNTWYQHPKRNNNKLYVISGLTAFYAFWDYTIHVIILQFMKEYLFPFNNKLLYEVRTIYIWNVTKRITCLTNTQRYSLTHVYFFSMACAQGRSLSFLSICIYNVYISHTYVCWITIYNVEGNIIAINPIFRIMQERGGGGEKKRERERERAKEIKKHSWL